MLALASAAVISTATPLTSEPRPASFSARTSSCWAIESCCSAVDSSALRCSASRVRTETRCSRCWLSSLNSSSRSRSRCWASINWSRSRNCSVWRTAASTITITAAASQVRRADGDRWVTESCSVTAKVTPTTTISGSTRNAPS